MPPRLAAGFWVQAYRMRLEAAMIPVYISHRGDETAGAVLVKVATLDGNATAYERRTTLEGREWMVLAQGPERDVDAAIARQRGFDPDLWVIELEDAKGRTLLDDPGLE